MAKSEKQKQKLLALVEIFKTNTDYYHGITINQIIEELKKYGINAERKSIYKDVEELNDFGYEIEKYKQGSTTYYSMISREFELPELKLLIDAVQSSKFISERRSNELIKKIEHLSSKYTGADLHRQVYVANRIKTNYESVYYTIDEINNAINTNSEIMFDYYDWTLKKEMELRKDGHKTGISPWALMWDDENYYMVAYEEGTQLIKHYRIDKMRKINLTNVPRKGREHFEKFDMAIYAKKVFNMFSGQEQTVQLEFDNNLIGVVMDRFGQDIMVIPNGPDKFKVNVNVSVSNMFFGWLVGIGKGVKILGPENVVDKFKQEMKNINDRY